MKRLALFLCLFLCGLSPVLAGEDSPTPTPLSGSSSIEGTVRDADGTPLAGVSVKGFFFASRESHFSRKGETDAGGAYGFTGLPACTVKITVELTGYAKATRSLITLTENNHLTGMDFALSKERTISGRIVDTDQEPIQGVFATARPDGEKFLKGAARPAGSGARSGDDGRYSIGALSEGTYTVRTSSPDFAPAEKGGSPPGRATWISH